MDELIGEFIEETNEALDVIDQKIIEFEKNPQNQDIIDHIFRSMHTIKGTCGFLNMPRLEKISHAGESLIGKFREGGKPSKKAVNLILKTIDQIKKIISQIEKNGKETPEEKNDQILINKLNEICDEIEKKQKVKKNYKTPLEQRIYIDELLKNGQKNSKQIENQITDAHQKIKQNFSNDNSNTSDNNSSDNNNTSDNNNSDKNNGLDKNKNIQMQKTIRVNVNTIENLMNTVRELVLTRNQLQNILRKKNDQENDTEFRVPIQNLSSITAELQENIMKTRMQPIGHAWQTLPRVVRELSNELQKQVEIKMFGDKTELDRQILELIKDPLTHMVRNCIDHAIEKPEIRTKNGKSPQGQIILSAKHKGGHIIIQLKDDGAGINIDKIKSKCIEKNVATKEQIDKMSDKQIYQYIFHPGFSTAEKVTNISGRGVGMDVVRKNIEIIGGSVEVKSEKNKGTEFNIKIPLTLAIVSSLIVVVGEEKFAIPQLAVVELVRVAKTSDVKIEMINNVPLLRLRKKLLPLVYLDKILKIDKKKRNKQNQFIVIIKDSDKKLGVVVDNIFDNEEIVIKPVSELLRSIKIYSGITILGDGNVIMILEPNAIIEQFFLHNEDNEHQEYNVYQNKEKNENLSKMILFHKGEDKNTTPMAIPLELVTRIEKIKPEQIDYCGENIIVKYREKLMKITFLDQNTKKQLQENKIKYLNILVFSKGEKYCGLVIGDIIDIIEENVVFYADEKQKGIFCTTIINQKVTNIVDVEQYIFNSYEKTAHNKEENIQQKKPIELDKSNLILVDDSFFFRNMITPILKAAGYNVTVCKSAAKAIEIIKNSETFDIVITDIEMPDINGFEFVTMLREIPKYQNVPVIALSGIYSKEAVNKNKNNGFQSHVAKFDRKGLLEVLKQFNLKSKAA